MRVLVNRTDAIGDNLLSLPMMIKLKKKFPEAHLAVLIHPRVRDIYTNHPFIDQVFEYDRTAAWPRRFSRLVKIFRSYRPDHYFFLGGCRLPNWVAFLTGVGFRGGLKSKWSSFLLLNKGVRQQRSIVAMHESEYNLELLRPLGLEYHHQELSDHAPFVALTDQEKREALADFHSYLEQQGKKTTAELVFIHPGMTGHTLNWPSRNYGRLITRLERNFPNRFLFLISHTPSDAPHLAGLRDHLKHTDELVPEDRLVFFNGAERGLRFTMNLLSQASLFIGPSTGVTHLASILGVRTLALYSPIKVQSSLRWGPFYQKTKATQVVVPDVVCGETFKCLGQSCPYYECMSKIEVEDVIKRISSLME